MLVQVIAGEVISDGSELDDICKYRLINTVPRLATVIWNPFEIYEQQIGYERLRRYYPRMVFENEMHTSNVQLECSRKRREH